MPSLAKTLGGVDLNAAAAAIAANTAAIAALSAQLDARDQKASVRAASLSNLTLSGAQTIDGVACIAGDRVAALGQTLSQNSGLYVVAAGAWSRSTDADTSAEVTSGMFFWVTEGTANGDKAFELTTNDPIVLGTTPLTFQQFAGALKSSQITNDSAVSGATSADALNTLNTGKANAAWTVRTVTGTTDTLLAADLGNAVLYTNAGAVAVSVPGGLPLGVYPCFVMGGAATQLTFAGTSGLTVTPAPGFTLKSRVGASGAAVALNVLSATVAILSGDMAFS